MITTTNGEWTADVNAMTCRNTLNNVIVIFEKKGESLQGKIDNMSMELLTKMSSQPHGERSMEQLVTDAEEVFLRAYFESDIEKKKKADKS